MLFAIVYVVEGSSGARRHHLPAAQLLPEGYRLDPVQVTAYLAILNFPWIIKPVFGWSPISFRCLATVARAI
jgi:hypothetical protein